MPQAATEIRSVTEFRVHPGPQQTALASEADIVIFGGAKGGGKLLALDTPLPIPSGWTTIGDVVEGDTVFDECGHPCRVLRAYDIDPSPVSYRMEFDDGSVIVAGADHLWLTYTAVELVALSRRTDEWRARRRAWRKSRATFRHGALKAAIVSARNSAHPPPSKPSPTGVLRTTKEIAGTLTVRGGLLHNHAIQVAGPLSCPEADLPLDPYLLGCWLGDGTSRDGAITSADSEIVRAFRQGGFTPTKWNARYGWGLRGLSALLRVIGVLGHKHIPVRYLRASREQRLALLQGLMDTDGTAARHGTVTFSTTNPQLRDGALELICSLGWKGRARERRAKLYGKDCGPCWNLHFSPDMPVFRLLRKLDRQHASGRRTTRFRYIVACDEIAPVPMRCLTVTASSGLFLAGRTMIPTHNSWALLLTIIQYAQVPEFSAVIFRRTYGQLTMPGGLWPESFRLFPSMGGVVNLADFRWTFPSGATALFSHMEHPMDRFRWDGAQIPMIGWDQLESFSEEQFWYLPSCNRAPRGGVRPWMFATCNPVPDTDATGGWLHRLVQWWIDPASGRAIPERSGKARWVIRRDDALHWADSRSDLVARHPERTPEGALIYEPKSITFIASQLEDNPTLTHNDPGYLSRIMLMPFVERERLLGNWNVRPTAGSVFNRGWFDIVDAAPADARRVRSWDKAGTSGGGAYSAGVKMVRAGGTYYVEDVIRGQWSPHQRNLVMRQVAEADGPEVTIWIETEPGSGGKESSQISIRELAGYSVHAETVTGDKVTRAQGLSAQAEAGNVKLVRGEWNEAYLAELHGFPEGKYKDQVDASSAAFAKLALTGGAPSISVLGQAAPAAPRRVFLRG